MPYWDFDFTDPSDEPRDSSAGAIAVCGLLEMSELLDGAEAEYYRDAALKLLKALVDNRDPQPCGIGRAAALFDLFQEHADKSL